jgi:hypothetical protein
MPLLFQRLALLNSGRPLLFLQIMAPSVGSSGNSSSSSDGGGGAALPAAIYVLDLAQAGQQAAALMLGQLAPLLQDSAVAKVLHDARQVGAESARWARMRFCCCRQARLRNQLGCRLLQVARPMAQQFGVRLAGVLDVQACSGMAALVASGSIAAPDTGPATLSALLAGHGYSCSSQEQQQEPDTRWERPSSCWLLADGCRLLAAGCWLCTGVPFASAGSSCCGGGGWG